MTPHAIALVRQSWRAMAPAAPKVAEAFYSRLFALDPGIRARFAATDLDAQGRKLTDTLATVVQALDDPDELVTLAARLGRSHAGYGISSRQYDLFGEALLHTVHTTLDPAWNIELHDAWAEAYTLFTSVMRRASARASGEFPADLPQSL